MSDRFRDLEMTPRAGRKNAVLLATVSSFESIEKPTGREKRQFSDLFVPLFAAADPEARRTAAAALSRHADVPEAVWRAIAEQPADIAAPFLVHTSVLDDATLCDMLRDHPEHARALARRASLSRPLVECLVSLGDPGIRRTLSVRKLLPSAEPGGTYSGAAKLEREEQLRSRLRMLARQDTPRSEDHTGFPVRIAHDIEARLLRHARQAEPEYFATALADALSSSFALAERIMLDVSGRQLAQTLVALGMRYTTITVVLEALFPHLAAGSGENRKSLALLRECFLAECIDRIAAWQRADAETAPSGHHTPFLAAPDERARPARETPGRTTGSRTSQAGAARLRRV